MEAILPNQKLVLKYFQYTPNKEKPKRKGSKMLADPTKTKLNFAYTEIYAVITLKLTLQLH